MYLNAAALGDAPIVRQSLEENDEMDGGEEEDGRKNKEEENRNINQSNIKFNNSDDMQC